jgi:hypothetical protein
MNAKVNAWGSQRSAVVSDWHTGSGGFSGIYQAVFLGPFGRNFIDTSMII